MSAKTGEERSKHAKIAGLAAAASMTPEQRSERARIGGLAANRVGRFVNAIEDRVDELTDTEVARLEAIIHEYNRRKEVS